MKIGIIGLGLIGGSLAKIFKKNNLTTKIVAFNRTEAPLLDAYKDNNIDMYTTKIDDSFKDLDIIFICTPVDKIISYVESLKQYITPDCILTDVGSTKINITKQLATVSGITFIGGHPMAGSEKTGYSAATCHLFENAYYILTPYDNTPTHKVDVLTNLIKQIGAIPVTLTPENHDLAVAGISHLPHVIASALVNSVNTLDKDSHTMSMLAANGFKDITRIASASPYIWESICLDNKNAIIKTLTVFLDELKSFQEDLNNQNIFSFFETAKEYRDNLISNNTTIAFKNFEFKVDIVDKPGIIATIATLLSVNNINIKNIGIINNREFENGVLSISLENKIDMENSIKLLKNMNYKVYV